MASPGATVETRIQPLIAGMRSLDGYWPQGSTHPACSPHRPKVLPPLMDGVDRDMALSGSDGATVAWLGVR